MFDELELSGIQDEKARAVIVGLMNLVESLSQEVAQLRAENEHLRDELRRLKGGSGKPEVRGSKGEAGPSDYSSERERRQPRPRTPRSKLAHLVVTREEQVAVPPASLPADAAFKGYDEVIIQDLRVAVEVIRFRKEKYYSAAEGRHYLASLPQGYDGQFGPGLRAWVLVWYFASNMSQPKILELLWAVGLQISAGQLSTLLIKDQTRFHQERAASFAAGLASSPWHHHDQTTTAIKGVEATCQITCNPLYTNYHTTPTKDRQSVLDALRGGQARAYLYNQHAAELLSQMGVARHIRARLAAHFPQGQRLDETAFTAWLDEHLPTLGQPSRKRIGDSCAIAAYQSQADFPVVQLLISDDAPQMALLTPEQGGCWIHEGRHYAKLSPRLGPHQTLLAHFRDKFWTYYDDLLAYRAAPSPAEATRLEAEFEALFTPETGFWLLDQRLALTRAKKRDLLAVLAHPEIPLHNNPAELGARARVRKRDVSFGPRTPDGTAAWDTFQSLAATTAKLGVSFVHYICDRLAGTNLIPPLADLIRHRAPALNLAASWQHA